MMANRKFNWVSSSNPNNALALKNLHEKMIHFYSDLESRNNYQQMVDVNDNDLNNPGIVTTAFLKFLKEKAPQKILEVGCGAARIYQFINKELKNADYTGIEVSKNIININRSKFPDATWLVSDAYSIPAESGTIDFCFSFYVLEHLVYPEKALTEMMRILKHNGYLILIFPDFTASGRFASQKIGLGSYPTALSRLKKGKFFDAIISLYDSKIRLPRALKNAAKQYGNFPVNINPRCLIEQTNVMWPDIDAVYIASKKEVENWALKQGYPVTYPGGNNNYFAEHGFMALKKYQHNK